MRDFLLNFVQPVFVSNKEMDRHERDQDIFVEALCEEEYLKIIESRDDGYMIGLTPRGRTVTV